MTNSFPKKPLLIIGLASVVFDANAAATATATVTANIVPLSSFSASESFSLSVRPDKNSDVQHALINDNRIEISSLNDDNGLKVKIVSYRNNIYDLSISSNSILTGPDSSNKMKIDNLKVDNHTQSLSSNNEQSLIIKGVLTKADGKNTGPYSGTTEITLNYN